MSLAPGTRLGPYELIGAIGAGGMGEVYRARDTVLNRDVAIKVLPDSLTGDADRLARFQREAEVLAALNHPNIAQVFGLEKSGPSPAIVMELVEGPTLAEVLDGAPGLQARGGPGSKDPGLPLDEALPLARQIVEALEAAHERGIIHRDLKPANVKVRDDGTVKVLDFGLAKAMDPPGEPGPDLAMSPTLTARSTQPGVILGTAAYMAPEQAKGRAVDRRADVWAFGVVLYEMLTGRRAFNGEDVSDTLASVLKDEPDWTALPQDLPARVGQVIRACLTKAPKQRIADMQTVRLVLDGVFEGAAPASNGRTGIRWQTAWLGVAVGIVVGGLLAGLAWQMFDREEPVPASAAGATFSLTLPEPQRFPSGGGTLVALSADGSKLVYRAASGGTWQLHLRSLDALASRPLPGTEGVSPGPAFFSDDGQWVAFARGTQLLRVNVSGGPPVPMAELPAGFRGATWVGDTIILGLYRAGGGLLRLSVTDGAQEVIPAPAADVWCLYPQWLPGGRTLLYTASSGTPGTPAEARLVAYDVESGTTQTLLSDASGGWYSPTGHLVYLQEGALWATRFDTERLTLDGSAVPIEQGVRVEVGGAVQFAAAGSVLAYLPGGVAEATRELAWIDARGRVEPIPGPRRAYLRPRLSPDGARLAVMAQGEQDDLYILDLARGSQRRLTFNPGIDRNPVWRTNDEIVFARSVDGGPLNVYSLPADADANVQAELLYESPEPRIPFDVSRSGLLVIGGIQNDLFAVDLNGDRTLVPLLASGYIEDDPRLSPDGRWMAYETNESGRKEVYVRPFPDGGLPKQVSGASGQDPAWSRDGRTLFFRSGTDILSASVTESGRGTLVIGSPQVIVADSGMTQSSFPTFDVAPDGRRFVIVRSPPDQTAAVAPAIVVITDLGERLSRLLPVR